MLIARLHTWEKAGHSTKFQHSALSLIANSSPSGICHSPVECAMHPTGQAEGDWGKTEVNFEDVTEI